MYYTNEFVDGLVKHVTMREGKYAKMMTPCALAHM
jgi:hypothetical protein